MLGLQAIKLKVNPTDISGSQETNFYVEFISPKIILEQSELMNLDFYNETIPTAEMFLLPIIAGEEDSLNEDNPFITEKITKIFAEGYIIDGVYKSKDFEKTHISYYLCRK